MKDGLPTFPFNDGEGVDGWFKGLDLVMDELKYDQKFPFKDSTLVWNEILLYLEEEGSLVLTDFQKNIAREIFDKLWVNYQEK